MAERSAVLIETRELTPLIGTPDLLLVDCRHDLAKPPWGAAVYAQGHLPGAVFAALDRDLSSPIRPGTGRHPLPSAADFAHTLGRWGYTARTRIVAYDQGPGAYAARLWWMLRAIGHHAVQVLNGGLAAWVASGGKLDAATPVRVPREVAPREFAGVLTSAEVEKELAARRITLVDARGADRFAGQNEVIDPVPGHVPGAINHPFTNNLDAAQQFLPSAELSTRWATEMRLAHAAPLVAMCGSGVTACHNLLALELAGYGDARLYAGSYSEWIADPRRPVATGVES